MLDHGELNIPLAKRGNIDAQLDRYKAQQAAARAMKAKADAVTRKIDKARARELFAEVGDAIIAKHGQKFGAKALRDMLSSQAKWEPARFIRMAETFKRESASARAVK